MIEYAAALLIAFFVVLFIFGKIVQAFHTKRRRLSEDPNAQKAADAFVAALGQTEKTLYAAFPSELLLDYYFQSLDNIVRAEKEGDTLAFSTALGEMVLMQTEIVERYVVLLHKDRKSKK
jgi:hypothetical protein